MTTIDRLRALSAVQALKLHLDHGVERPYGVDPASVVAIAAELAGVGYPTDRIGMTAAVVDLRALLARPR